MSKIVFVLLLFAILIADNSAREIQRTKRQSEQEDGGLAGTGPGSDIEERDRMMQMIPPGQGPVVAQLPPTE
ncbi:unnamed protein product [Cylicocyclus nassatus]|uniref:Uncharacterized protein n=1 Tax=Cylicocyclus nassatus TaxID=53992 RepID=A0AA36DSY3_CYLNA|nr:unnamed protein product [Cylicocyclus nassatus]